MMGRAVIQCEIDSELSYDPLGDLTHNRYVWDKNTSLKSLFDSSIAGSSNEIEFAQEKGRAFVRSYFEKFRPEVLLASKRPQG